MKVHGYEVPKSLLDALQTRLQREPATAWMLAGTAASHGAPSHNYTAHRIVDRWLRQQKKLGTVEFLSGRREWRWRPL